jgi:hypothetical protein
VFALDDENSALSRLVNQVEETKDRIMDDFLSTTRTQRPTSSICFSSEPGIRLTITTIAKAVDGIEPELSYIGV